MADFVQIDPVTGDFIVDMPPDYTGGVTDEIKAGPVPEGFIRPRWQDGAPAWIEGATQQELDDRAAFLAEQSLIDAARDRLQALAAANKSIAGDIDLIERAVLLPLGKALVVRSLALRTAAAALKTPGATAAEVRTSVINYATAAESAEVALLLAIKDIRDAITDREGT